MVAVKKPPVSFSRHYQFVRARQLEGTYPGDRATGVWPITAWRVSWGWGRPPEEAWPYETSVWPPVEPVGIDILARTNLGLRYQRVRSLYECKLVLAYHSLPSVSMDITKAWLNPPGGRIPRLRRDEPTIGSHTVALVGYDDSKQQLLFINSWGPDWGDKGYGTVGYRTFERTWCEGWFFYPAGITSSPTRGGPMLKRGMWGMREFGGGILHGREIVGPGGERMAWAFAVQRAHSLDVEELFVKPQHRRRGFGKGLVQMLGKLAFEIQQNPRVWISYPDATPENLFIVENLPRPLKLRLREAPVRWAPFVFCAVREKLDPTTLSLRGSSSRDSGSTFPTARARVK